MQQYVVKGDDATLAVHSAADRHVASFASSKMHSGVGNRVIMGADGSAGAVDHRSVPGLVTDNHIMFP